MLEYLLRIKVKLRMKDDVTQAQMVEREDAHSSICRCDDGKQKTGALSSASGYRSRVGWPLTSASPFTVGKPEEHPLVPRQPGHVLGLPWEIYSEKLA